LALGTPGYFPEATKWQNGCKKWDIWAIVAMICEADMKKDGYLGTKRESEAKSKIAKHLKLPTTCKKLKEIVEKTISLSYNDPMINLINLEEMVIRMKFQK